MALNSFQEEEAGAGWGCAVQISGILVVSSGQRGDREEGGMEAEKEGLLRVRDEQDIAGDWESGARRGQEEQGPA